MKTRPPIKHVVVCVAVMLVLFSLLFDEKSHLVEVTHIKDSYDKHAVDDSATNSSMEQASTRSEKESVQNDTLKSKPPALRAQSPMHNPTHPPNLSSAQTGSQNQTREHPRPPSNRSQDLLRTHTSTRAPTTAATISLGPKTERTGTQNQTRDHPHAGALYPDGTWGYVADVTRVRRMMLQRFQKERHRYNASLLSFLSFNNSEEFEQVCNVAPGAGHESAMGYDMLINRVIVNGPDPQPSNQSNTSMIHLSTAPRPITENRPARGSRILCAVYTHAGAIARMEGIADTWAW
jgi:hypothetical protein